MLYGLMTPPFFNHVFTITLLCRVCFGKNLEVERFSSKEKQFGQSALLMNATYIVFEGDL